MEQQINISKQEYERLTHLAAAAADLKKYFIPTINFAASCITAEGAAALNDFGVALNELTDHAD